MPSCGTSKTLLLSPAAAVPAAWPAAAASSTLINQDPRMSADHAETHELSCCADLPIQSTRRAALLDSVCW
jgi:hypothetical protein